MAPDIFITLFALWHTLALSFKFNANEIQDFADLTANPLPVQGPDFHHPSWVHDCKSIYLDLGSNIGVQVRKLYEPNLYCGAMELKSFNHYFGSPKHRRARGTENGLCALAFEPNPVHHHRLHNLEKYYNALGWHVHFYPYAAWREEDFLVFNEALDAESGSWRANLTGSKVNRNASDEVQVRTVDIAAFIKSLPLHSVKLMTMDIGGAEYETLYQMLSEKVLCRDTIDAAFVVAHPWGDIANWKETRNFDTIQKRVAALDCGIAGSPTTTFFKDDKPDGMGKMGFLCTNDMEKASIGKIMKQHKAMSASLGIILAAIIVYLFSMILQTKHQQRAEHQSLRYTRSRLT